MNYEKEIANLRRENYILKRALKFYSNPLTYGYDGEPRTDNGDIDAGDVARNAFKLIKGKQNESCVS